MTDNTIVPLPQQSSSGSSRASRAADAWGARLISLLFVVVGIVAIAGLAWAVASDTGIQSAVSWDASKTDEAQPSLILAFLVSFGIVVPILVIGLGLFFIGLGIRLRKRSLSAARWAHIALMWLCVGLGFVVLLNGITLAGRLLSSESASISPADLGIVVIPLFFVALAYGVWRWLGHRTDRIYSGSTRLRDDTTRLAWSLLIPSLAVVILVAARPLEQTFIRSLTDKRFASQDVPQFVGLANYQRLFSIRADLVECRRESPETPCSLRDNGSIRWQSIDSSLLQEGYRTAWTVSIPILMGSDRALAISSLDEDFLRAIGTTLLFVVVSVSFELVIALFMALTVNSAFRGRGIMRAVMLIPWAIPTVISARLWELMLKDTSAGIVNSVLMDLGVIQHPQAWLSDPNLQLAAAVMVDVWKTVPFMALLLLAGLQLIPSDLYEAADVDGAGKARQFFAITLPLLRPTIVVALVFRTLDALRVFDLFNVLFGRQQLTMATYNYETLINNQQDGYASAISVVIFLLILAFALTYIRILKVETA